MSSGWRVPLCPDQRCIQQRSEKDLCMAYTTLSTWNVTGWTDEMEATARDKFIPMILSVGATKVQMVRTGDLAFSVITEYAAAQKAEVAQARIAEIRAQAGQELVMTMASSASGEVFAKS
jgi:hypothetical protein